MKIKLITAFLLLLSLNINAQEWDLFYKGDTVCFNSAGWQKVFRVDSVERDGEFLKYHTSTHVEEFDKFLQYNKHFTPPLCTKRTDITVFGQLPIKYEDVWYLQLPMAPIYKLDSHLMYNVKLDLRPGFDRRQVFENKINSKVLGAQLQLKTVGDTLIMGELDSLRRFEFQFYELKDTIKVVTARRMLVVSKFHGVLLIPNLMSDFRGSNVSLLQRKKYRIYTWGDMYNFAIGDEMEFFRTADGSITLLEYIGRDSVEKELLYQIRVTSGEVVFEGAEGHYEYVVDTIIKSYSWALLNAPIDSFLPGEIPAQCNCLGREYPSNVYFEKYGFPAFKSAEGIKTRKSDSSHNKSCYYVAYTDGESYGMEYIMGLGIESYSYSGTSQNWTEIRYFKKGNRIMGEKSVGIANPERELMIDLFPNPSQSGFTLTSKEQISCMLCRMDGSRVESFTCQAQSSLFFGQNLPAGIYLLHVSSGSAQRVYKLVKG